MFAVFVPEGLFGVVGFLIVVGVLAGIFAGVFFILFR